VIVNYPSDCATSGEGSVSGSDASNRALLVEDVIETTTRERAHCAHSMVLDTNSRSKHFYERMGITLDRMIRDQAPGHFTLTKVR
jgi:hypothetical protein